MRGSKLLRVALVLLRQVSGGAYGDALCGDLVEEFARTGSTSRLWREIAAGLARGLWRQCAASLQPLVFSAGWSLLYPVWQAMEGNRVWPALAQRSHAMEWPYSSVALLTSAGLSPLLFVWCGALLYMARNERMVSWGVASFRVVRGLSLSLSVLLVSWMVLMRYAGPDPSGHLAGEAVFVPGVHLSWLNVAIMLSLLVATFPARLSRRSQQMR